MISPTVHLNGTSRSALVAQLTDATMALDAAMTAVALAAPHGRDYYPQGDDAIYKAQAEHHARLNALREMRDEYQQIAIDLLLEKDRG